MVGPRIALVSATAAAALDEDLPPLLDAVGAAGGRPQLVAWDDPEVPWHAFAAAVLRSTWDYAERLAEFLDWASRVARATRLINPLSVVRWNTDKHYLAELERAGVAIVPSRFIEPTESIGAAVARALSQWSAEEIVVKPSVGAGSRDAQRHMRTAVADVLAHVHRLHASGRSALLQPYLPRVAEAGETALVYLGGRFSHALRKGPLLHAGAGPTEQLFAPEEITPRVVSQAEQQLADRVLRVVEQTLRTPPLTYARVDLIRDDADEPRLLEVELTEPSLFFRHAPGSARHLADTILEAVAGSA